MFCSSDVLPLLARRIIHEQDYKTIMCFLAASPRHARQVVYENDGQEMSAQRLPVATDDGVAVTVRTERNGVSLNSCGEVESREAAVQHLHFYQLLFGSQLSTRLVSLDVQQSQELLLLLEPSHVYFETLETTAIRPLFSSFLRETGKNYKSLTKVQHLKLLRSLPADEQLTGCDTFSELRHLDAGYQTVRRIDPLRHLQSITFIVLSGTLVDNTAVLLLSRLPHLHHVELDQCGEISNLNPLSQCSSLAVLSAKACPKLLQFHSIGECPRPLRLVDLSHNVLRDVEVRRFMAAPLRTETLSLTHVALPTCDGAVRWQVRYLHLCGTYLREARWLGDVSGLEEVLLDSTNVTDGILSQVAPHWGGVTVLSLSNCSDLRTDLGFIAQMTSLTILTISSVSLTEGCDVEALGTRYGISIHVY